MKWVKYERGGELPPLYRAVLVQLERIEQTNLPASVVVGQLQLTKEPEPKPYFVTPGIYQHVFARDENDVLQWVDRHITHWCDCFGEDFHAPLWSDLTKSPAVGTE